MNEDFLEEKLSERRQNNAYRSLIFTSDKTDFCSNDYLGIVKNNLIEQSIQTNLSHGSSGSRLLSGNYKLIEETENLIANFHNAPAGVIFNSGFDANTGLLSCVPQKGDVIIYDQLSHASIREGIRLSFASSFSFLHNDVNDLEKKITASIPLHQNIFVVTESVFSMDGDMAPLIEISELCEKYDAGLIVDEAHATGIIGEKGEGLVQQLRLQQKCFARIHTFGKACGCHGAIVLGSVQLKNYLINFSRQFIYSTSLPPSVTAAIAASYNIFPSLNNERNHLNNLIAFFKKERLKYPSLNSDTPIQVVIIPGNEEVKKVAISLQENKLDVRAILYPTVPKGKERLRIVFHAFNTMEETENLINLLS
ncbi:pyridoxal phosphate-dependent aminotransferase family protein [Ginsengibacter hankyongi]|uniref:Pyridoxal phosphate-dependent aminotransferase family protein n=1 Tax=Ginsengibacter hankyongi TaxID=2607284 RepID=A0A5J5IBW2_9BACT|nr:pyridoxal phosphate-dependent aminotransferase family protein [Ginsengibacter hankyongi]KAA9034632.1 pyridoxal phosphate-dependent aminotransferase family protein [Ginsengibacter hankyongi]